MERIVVDVPFKPCCRPWNDLLCGQWGVVDVIRVTTHTSLVGFGETLLHSPGDGYRMRLCNR